MSAKVFKGNFSKYTSNMDDIFADIDSNELERRKDASKYAVKIMKRNASKKGVSSPGGFPARRSGVTRRKIGMQLLKKDRSAKIGSKDFKIHLIEFGHGDGKERNKRPLVFPSLQEAEPGIIGIMSREYF